MDIEKIEALPLTKAQAMGYAKSVVGAPSPSAAKTGKRSP